jgi:hypothetical protein
MAGEPFAPGIVALVTPQGTARLVADGLAFPNGMLVTPDNATLIVAESYGKKLTAFDIEDDGSLSNRRGWAELGDGVPDGICLDAENAVWYWDVPNQRCVRVREGGEVLQMIELDRGCTACALGGPGRRTLFMTAIRWDGPEKMFAGPRTGQVLTADAPAAGAGWRRKHRRRVFRQTDTMTGDRPGGRLVTPDNKKWWTLAAVSSGLFMIMLDVTIVNIAFPISAGCSRTIRSAACPGSSAATTSCSRPPWCPGGVLGRMRAWGWGAGLGLARGGARR